MTCVTENTPVLQWHPAFYAGIRIELAEEKEGLIFENEHQLGTKPKEIDVLIIKKNADVKIHKNIGRIFRKYNIIEYKSPKDYLSIDDYYKVYGYACFYKSDTDTVNQIKAEEITISFVCKKRPKELFLHLQTERNLAIEENGGIYYVYGDFFPVQIIITSELPVEENFWLHHLTDDLKTVEEADEIIRRYESHQNENLHKSVMNIIVNANKLVFEEAKGMCEALLELFKDELEEGRERGRLEGILEKEKELIKIKLAKGKTPEEIADALEDTVENIAKLIQEINSL